MFMIMHAFVPHTDSIALNSNCAHTNLQNITFKAFFLSNSELWRPPINQIIPDQLGLSKQTAFKARSTYEQHLYKKNKINLRNHRDTTFLIKDFSFPVFIDKGKNMQYRKQQERITAAVIPKDCGTTV